MASDPQSVNSLDSRILSGVLVKYRLNQLSIRVNMKSNMNSSFRVAIKQVDDFERMLDGELRAFILLNYGMFALFRE